MGLSQPLFRKGAHAPPRARGNTERTQRAVEIKASLNPAKIKDLFFASCGPLCPFQGKHTEGGADPGFFKGGWLYNELPVLNICHNIHNLFQLFLVLLLQAGKAFFAVVQFAA